MRRKYGGSMLGLALAVALVPSLASAAVIEAPHLAYVDPGAGSFILQALVAALAGAAVLISTYWRKIKIFFGISSAEDDEEAARTTPSDD